MAAPGGCLAVRRDKPSPAPHTPTLLHPRIPALAPPLSTQPPLQLYFDTLSRCRAILLAFAADDYFTKKSSSTVATAINVGVPLVAERRCGGARRAQGEGQASRPAPWPARGACL